jgi:hypothetical protein
MRFTFLFFLISAVLAAGSSVARQASVLDSLIRINKLKLSDTEWKELELYRLHELEKLGISLSPSSPSYVGFERQLSGSESCLTDSIQVFAQAENSALSQCRSENPHRECIAVDSDFLASSGHCDFGAVAVRVVPR